MMVDRTGTYPSEFTAERWMELGETTLRHISQLFVFTFVASTGFYFRI